MQDRRQQLYFLGELVKKAGLGQLWIYNILESLQIHWSDKMYAMVLQQVMANLDPGVLLYGRFTLPASQGQITGELDLGQIIGTTKTRFQFPISDLAKHIFVAGSSGFGKSTFAMILAEECLLAGLKGIRIVDPKADDYFSLARKYPNILILKWSDLRFNPLTPPPNVARKEWHQTIVGHLAQSFNFWQGSEALLLRQLAKNPVGITLPNLLADTQHQKKLYSQKDAFVISTVTSRMQMLMDLFGEVIMTNSTMLEELSDKKVIISTAGLMTESESWFTEFLLLWEYMYRVNNPSKRGLALHIFDECQHRLFSSEKERKVQKLGASVISQLVDQARALNIGICSLSQEPSTLINAVINNSFLKVCFHLGSGSEVRVVKEAIGLNDEQAEMLHYIETGEAIVRTAGGYMDAIPVKIDNFDCSSLSEEDGFWQQQLDMKRQLYDETIKTPLLLENNGFRTMTNPISGEQLKPTKRSSFALNNDNYLAHLSDSGQIPKEIFPILQVWLNLKNPFLTQGEIFDKIGITSGSSQAKIKNLLLRRGYIIEHKLQVGKTHCSVWQPTGSAFKIAGILERHFSSKGGYLHQFAAYHIRLWAEKNGFTVKVEFQLSNGKAVDLFLQKENELQFIEIAISRPLEKELGNIYKDLNTNLIPDQLVITATNSTAKAYLEKITSEDKGLDKYRNLIHVKLIGDYMKP